MAYFEATTHEIRFRLGLRPRPHWGAYSIPPDFLAGFQGPASKGEEERGYRRGKERKGMGWKIWERESRAYY